MQEKLGYDKENMCIKHEEGNCSSLVVSFLYTLGNKARVFLVAKVLCLKKSQSLLDLLFQKEADRNKLNSICSS